MRILDLLDIRSIEIQAKPLNKTDMLHKMADLMKFNNNILDIDIFAGDVIKREMSGSTGIGNGLAIPHGKSAAVTKPGISLMIIPEGIDFDSIDGQPVRLAFLIAVPENGDSEHLAILSSIAVMMRERQFIEQLINAHSVEEVIGLLYSKDIMLPESFQIFDEKQDKDNGIKLLAVTGCPTGIAHTYMAADSLIEAAEKQGISIKVETRGASGVKNLLTDEEIKDADSIIIASDIQVPMKRFSGKKIIKVSVSEGVSNADQLIDNAVNGFGRILIANEEEKHSREDNRMNLIHSLYSFLMSGITHMLPFVVAGGILIAMAMLIDGFMIDMNSLSISEREMFGSITPFAALLYKIGSLSMSLMLPALSGYIAFAIAERPGLAVGFVGGLIAANGNSALLGAVTAGFAAGYIVIILKRIFSKVVKYFKEITTVLFIPVISLIILGILMIYIIEPVMGMINLGISSFLNEMGYQQKVFMGIILGLMMSVDFGGPVNKAAYVFGMAAVANGDYEVMAAVMVSGMCPPIGVSLATFIFKNKFTDQELKAGPSNLLMGLSFVTEGVIPYAIADPVAVIPSCMMGAALAGGLSVFFGCTLMAPHGGIFVFPVVGNPVMYILSLVSGSLLTAVMLGVLKSRK